MREHKLEVPHGLKPTLVRTYESPDEFGAEARRVGFRGEGRNGWRDSSGASDEALARAFETQRFDFHRQRIREARERLTLPDFRTYRDDVAFDVAGGPPCVPVVLANDPDSALSIEPSESASAPVRIVWDRVLSAAIEARKSEDIGAAVAALVSVVQTSRPCELWICHSIDVGREYQDSQGIGAFQMRYRIPLPLSDDAAALWLVAQAPNRALAYQIAQRDLLAPLIWAYAGTWPGGYNNRTGKIWGSEAISLAMTSDLRGDRAVFIPTLLSTAHPVVADPVEWVKSETVRLFGNDDAR